MKRTPKYTKESYDSRRGIKKDITGLISGRLTVLRFVEIVKGNGMWECVCECGKKRVVSYAHLTTGHTKSCGCYNRQKCGDQFRTHGMRHTTEYSSWVGMRERCGNPNNKKYPIYGGRGIKVCKRWLSSFENFFADMGVCPPRCSIDRIDNNGDYKPSNCRWATASEQCANRSMNSNITAFGNTLCISAWAFFLVMDPTLMRYYLNKGRSAGRDPEEIIGQFYLTRMDRVAANAV